MFFPIVAALVFLGQTPSVKDYVVYEKTELCDSTLMSGNSVGDTVERMVLEARCAVSADSPRAKGVSQNAWCLVAKDAAGNGIEVEVRRITDYIDDVNGGRRLHLAAFSIDRSGRKEICHSDVEKDVDLTGGQNTMSVDINGTNVSVGLGHRLIEPVMNFRLEKSLGEGASGYLKADGCVQPSVFVVERFRDPAIELMTDYNVDDLLSGKLLEDNRTEGLWRYLDRENDTDYARPGGFYRLATVKNAADGCIDIVYLGGAEVHDDKWHAGMLKGRLLPTVFVNHYDLKWYAADMTPVESEVFADMSEDGAILTLSFPELKSKLRFSRVPLASANR